MNVTTDIDSVVKQATAGFRVRSQADAWAACAAIWVRLWVLAGPGWERWQLAREYVLEALSTALSISVDVPYSSPIELVRIRLEGIDIEDDGSPECQHLADLVAVLTTVLDGTPLEACVDVTVRTFLEGTFNAVVNKLVALQGRSMSQAEAVRRLSTEPAWQQAVQFVQSL